MINFILWKWNDNKWASSYDHTHVNRMADILKRNYKGKCKIHCITDDSDGIRDDINIIPMWNKLAEFGHCYRRLYLFSKDMIDIFGNEKLVSVDLDAVITGDLTETIDSVNEFAICKDYQQGTPYNGSFFILKAGTRSQVWEKFNGKQTIDEAHAKGYAACDQSVIAHILGENEQVLGENEGFLSYKFYVLRECNGVLPNNAKFIAFHGNLKPWDNKVKNISWIKSNYRSTKRAIVLGGADCLQNDLLALGNIPDYCDIIAVNNSGYGYGGKIALWVTLHPEKLDKWRNQRKYNGYDMNFKSIGYGDKERGFEPKNVDSYSDFWNSRNSMSGSSGLFACKVALEHGYEEIILCGVPMNSDKNLYSGKAWTTSNDYRDAWKFSLDKIKGKVYSMSGWTKELLGGYCK